MSLSAAASVVMVQNPLLGSLSLSLYPPPPSFPHCLPSSSSVSLPPKSYVIPGAQKCLSVLPHHSLLQEALGFRQPQTIQFPIFLTISSTLRCLYQYCVGVPCTCYLQGVQMGCSALISVPSFSNTSELKDWVKGFKKTKLLLLFPPLFCLCSG